MGNSIFSRFKKEEIKESDDKTIFEDDRALWVELLDKIAFPVLDNLKKDNLKKKMPYESISSDRKKFSYLESFGRLFCGIAPWLELGPDETDEGKLREKYIKMTIKAFENITNPDSKDNLRFNEPKQSLVDAAFLAQGLLRSKKQIWLNLPIKTKASLIEKLKSTRIIAPFENYWLLFTSMIEAALLEFTGECDLERLTYGIYKFRDEWYIGDSIYADGAIFKLDFYNSIIIHPMLIDILIVMKRYDIKCNDFLEVELKRASRHSSYLERLISPEGTYPVYGESINYRTGIFHTLAYCSLLKILPRNIPPSQIRVALTKVIKKQFEGSQNFDDEGWLKVGLNGSQLNMAHSKINTGSLYLCSLVFLPLGLSFNDPFWTDFPAEWTNLAAWSGEPVNKDQYIDF